MRRKLIPPIFAVAPMMDWTDRHCRFFHRLLTRRALLYTEMVTTAARCCTATVPRLPRSSTRRASRGAATRRIGAGGARRSARIGEDFGYDEINLNVGCPSDRVQAGRFGACLMAEPALVGDCVPR